jgi:hypothetical protein
VRIAAFTLFFLAFAVLSLLDGIGASIVAALLAGGGALLVTARQLEDAAASEPEEPSVSVRVVRWNY